MAQRKRKGQTRRAENAVEQMRRKRKNQNQNQDSNQGGGKKGDALRKRATRDIRVAYKPLLQELNRERQQTRRDTDQNIDRVSGLYEALAGAFKPLGPQYDQRADAIAGDLNTHLGNLSGLLTPTSNAIEGVSATDNAAGEAAYRQMAAPEAQANLGVVGAIGAGGQQLLASDRQRNLGYQASAMRQAPLDAVAVEKQYLQDMRDTIDDIRSSRRDLVGRMPGEILAHLDSLRQTRKQNRLAQSELELRREIADKQLKEQRKSRKSATKQQNKGFNAATDIAQDEKTRTQLGKQIRRLNTKVIPGLNEDIRDIKDDYPNVEKRGDTWGYVSVQGDFVPLPHLNTLTTKRRRKTAKLKQARKRKRKL